MLDGRWGKTRCVLMKRNCVLFYLITVLREGNQARFELFGNIFKPFNAVQVLNPPVSLIMACKERYNLFVNRASLDRESLENLSLTIRSQCTLSLTSKNITKHYGFLMFWERMS